MNNIGRTVGIYFYIIAFVQLLAVLINLKVVGDININLSFIYVFLIYVTIFLVLSTIIGLPLGYYSSYIHEHKWGFSNYTKTLGSKYFQNL